MIDQWPHRIVFRGEFAHAEQREFSAHAIIHAPTGVNYNHYSEGRQIVFNHTAEELAAERGEPVKRAPAKKHVCRQHPSGRCRECHKPLPWRHR